VVDYEKFFSKESHYYKASDIRKLLDIVKEKEVISLGGGLPDLGVADIEEFLEAVKSVLANRGSQALQYSSTKGEGELIEALEEYLEKDLEIPVKGGESIIVTTGSQQAIDIIARGMLDPGDALLIEKPTYVASLNAFHPRRPKFVGLEITSDDSFSVEELEQKLEGLRKSGESPKILYTIPTYQNPTGAVLPPRARQRLLDLAHEYDFLIVEDDPYSLLTLDGERPRPIKSLDDEGRVIYISTLSKVVSPGLRIGFALAEHSLINRLSLIKQALDLHTSNLTQLIAAELLRSGYHRRYLSRALPLYRARRDAMLESLSEELSGEATWTRPRGGMFVFVWLKRGLDAGALLPKALERGVLYVPGAGFYYDSSNPNTMRLNFSYPTPEQIRKGIKVLGELVRSEVMLLG